MIWADKSIDPASVGSSGSAVLPGFFAGKYAMTMQGSYAAQQMAEDAPAGFHWVMLPPLQERDDRPGRRPADALDLAAEQAQDRGHAVHLATS